MKKYTILLISVALLTGCATTEKSMFYWGDYSETAVSYRVAPNDETLEQFKNTLENIIEKSNSKGMKVPPTIYFELGVIELKSTGKNYMAFFEKEMKLYPQSTQFITLYIKNEAP